MSIPHPTYAAFPPGGHDLVPDRPRSATWSVVTLVGLTAGLALIVGLVVTVVVAVFDVVVTGFGNTLSDVQGQGTPYERSTNDGVLTRLFWTTTGTWTGGQLLVAVPALLLCRLGRGFARMHPMVQGLLAWLTGLCSGVLALFVMWQILM